MSINRLVTHLLTVSLRRLPEELRGRYREEWANHHTHLQGWRLTWWALCLRATASRTGRACPSSPGRSVTDTRGDGLLVVVAARRWRQLHGGLLADGEPRLD